jgi:hypothetical protein
MVPSPSWTSIGRGLTSGTGPGFGYEYEGSLDGELVLPVLEDVARRLGDVLQLVDDVPGGRRVVRAPCPHHDGRDRRGGSRLLGRLRRQPSASLRHGRALAVRSALAEARDVRVVDRVVPCVGVPVEPDDVRAVDERVGREEAPQRGILIAGVEVEEAGGVVPLAGEAARLVRKGSAARGSSCAIDIDVGPPMRASTTNSEPRITELTRTNIDSPLPATESKLYAHEGSVIPSHGNGRRRA